MLKEDEIILNIGYKADGIITKNEYSNDASLVLTDAVHVGDTMEAKVLKSKRWRRSGYLNLQETWQQRKATNVLRRHSRTRRF